MNSQRAVGPISADGRKFFKCSGNSDVMIEQPTEINNSAPGFLSRISQAALALFCSRRRLTGLALLLGSMALAAMQAHAGHAVVGANDPYLIRVSARNGSAAPVSIRIPSPRLWGTYSVDLIMPNGANPSEFGLAYHEIRRNTSIRIEQYKRPSLLASAPSRATSMQFEDVNDARGGVELCEFAAESSSDVTIRCHLEDGPPWPAGVQIGVSHSSIAPRPLATASASESNRPYSLVISGLLACLSAALFWRS